MNLSHMGAKCESASYSEYFTDAGQSVLLRHGTGGLPPLLSNMGVDPGSSPLLRPVWTRLHLSLLGANCCQCCVKLLLPDIANQPLHGTETERVRLCSLTGIHYTCFCSSELIPSREHDRKFQHNT